MDPRVADELAARLDARLIGARPVSGGDVAAAYRVELDDGRIVFAKTHAGAPEGFFTTEAAGLSWLHDGGALAVPAVLAVADTPPLLALEWIDEGRAGPTTDAEFGQGLAALHRAGAPSFGRVDRRPTGSRSLPNDPAPTWAEFYATRRLLPLAEMAAAGRSLPERSVAGLRRVAERIEDLVGPVEPPARLHGDLWTGNRLVDRRA